MDALKWQIIASLICRSDSERFELRIAPKFYRQIENVFLLLIFEQQIHTFY